MANFYYACPHAHASDHTYPIPLSRQNQATLSFARLPLETQDLAVLKQWIELMAENLTESVVEHPKHE